MDFKNNILCILGHRFSPFLQQGWKWSDSWSYMQINWIQNGTMSSLFAMISIHGFAYSLAHTFVNGRHLLNGLTIFTKGNKNHHIDHLNQVTLCSLRKQIKDDVLILNMKLIFLASSLSHYKSSMSQQWLEDGLLPLIVPIYILYLNYLSFGKQISWFSISWLDCCGKEWLMIHILNQFQF